MKLLKLIGNTIYSVLFAFVILVAVLVGLSALNTPIFNYRFFTVLSGSMEAAIPTGSLIVVGQQPEYQVGDIVTVRFESDQDTVTHRVVEKTDQGIITKGDANEEPDRQPISADQIIGKTIVYVPYLGRVINFAQSEIGFVVLIVIPATIIVYSELKNIFHELKKLFKKKSNSSSNESAGSTNETT